LGDNVITFPPKKGPEVYFAEQSIVHYLSIKTKWRTFVENLTCIIL